MYGAPALVMYAATVFNARRFLSEMRWWYSLGTARFIMRRFVLLLLLSLIVPVAAFGQACTGLCLQQVACPAGGPATTSISGTVYSPNGTDPLPNVLVFIPNAAVPAFTPGVACLTAGSAPGGSPLVGTITAPDGTFHIDNVPVGSNIPLVIQSGRWRRQLTVSTVTACTDNSFSTRMPRNQIEGDIPLFAVATGSADQVECVLRKVGIDDAEFTNPLSTGRIHVYAGTNSEGAIIDANTPLQSSLMSNPSALNQYDVLMLPCQGGQYTQPAGQLSNLIQYANAGGRVYASHFSYVWMYRNPPFDTVANWDVEQPVLPDGNATVNPSFYGASTLTTWLQVVNASPAPGQVSLTTNKHDLNGVNPPTQAWITLNDPAAGNPVMQFTFNTPVGSTNQCGRILYNEYHIENRQAGAPPSTGKPFPTECSTSPMSSQEKLLEYSLFDLTNQGTQPTLTPSPKDFATGYIGFATAPQTFTWTNNSIFNASISSTPVTGDFAVTGTNGCSSVAPGGSCTISVVYAPTVTGPEKGTLSVVSNGNTATASLTGTGAQPLVVSTNALAFGNTDVGASVTQTFTVHNSASGAVALGQPAISGDYALSTTCGSTLAGGATCTASVTFTPSTTGARSGQVAFNGLLTSLTGNGVDFSTAFTPASGNDIAGIAVSTPVAVLPIAGYNASVTLTCTTTAPASSCAANVVSTVPSSGGGVGVEINTTAKYTVIGYGGVGIAGGRKSFAGRALMLLAFVAGGFVWKQRRVTRGLRGTVWLLVLCAAGCGLLSGCSSKTPALNPAYTPPGTYSYTLTATDGFLTHSATYSLVVAAK